MQSPLSAATLPRITTTDVEKATNVHGYIACSSTNNMVEINLRFPKCKCPQQKQELLCNEADNSKEIKNELLSCNNKNETNLNVNSEIKTKIINFDRNNLCNIVNNLDINTCTKCSISLDVKKLLTRIFSNPALNTIGSSNRETPFLNGGDSPSLLSASPRLSNSNISATENDEFIIFNFNKEKRNSTDKRSTGTQHEESSNGKSPLSKKNVIIITDEYKKKCSEHHIIVKNKKKEKKTKQPLSRSMENLSTPEIHRRGFLSSQKMNTTTKSVSDSQPNHSNSANNKITESHKTRSKSVDDISTSSNEVLLEGVESVELIFISDEFLNKANKQETEVIIVDDPSKMPSPRPTPSPNSQSGEEKLTNGMKGTKKCIQKDRSPRDRKIYKISDDFRQKSLNNTVIVVKQRDNKKKKLKDTISDQSIEEPLSLNIKTTSNTFLTYEEPWSPVDDLESKKIP